MQSLWLTINAELLITDVTFTLNEEGEITELKVMPKEAYEILADNKIEKASSSSSDSSDEISNEYLEG